MKRTAVALFFLFACRAFAQVAGYPDFELVESTPAGTVLDNPDIRDARDVWIEMINGARETLDIEQFYVSPQKGEPLDDVLAAITAAAARGVRVRLLADARMHTTYPATVDSLGLRGNISVRIIDYGKLAGGVQHAKYFIVDGREIFLGSQNFDWRALTHIHELGLRIRHTAAVRLYGDIFELDWRLAEHNDPAAAAGLLTPASAPVPFRLAEGPGDTIVFTPTMSPKSLIIDTALWDERRIVDLIDGAARELDCQVLTYSPQVRGKAPYRVLDDALRRAAARGVKVRMIVADWGKDAATVGFLKDLASVPNIEIKFSVIPEWSGGYIPFARVEHCKYLVADSTRCWLGTANWERGYFYNLRNVGVVVENARITALLHRIFMKGWDGPYTERITQEATYTPREHGERR